MRGRGGLLGLRKLVDELMDDVGGFALVSGLMSFSLALFGEVSILGHAVFHDMKRTRGAN